MQEVLNFNVYTDVFLGIHNKFTIKLKTDKHSIPINVLIRSFWSSSTISTWSVGNERKRRE